MQRWRPSKSQHLLTSWSISSLLPPVTLGRQVTLVRHSEESGAFALAERQWSDPGSPVKSGACNLRCPEKGCEAQHPFKYRWLQANGSNDAARDVMTGTFWFLSSLCIPCQQSQSSHAGGCPATSACGEAPLRWSAVALCSQSKEEIMKIRRENKQ